MEVLFPGCWFLRSQVGSSWLLTPCPFLLLGSVSLWLRHLTAWFMLYSHTRPAGFWKTGAEVLRPVSCCAWYWDCFTPSQSSLRVCPDSRRWRHQSLSLMGQMPGHTAEERTGWEMLLWQTILKRKKSVTTLNLKKMYFRN